MGCGVNSVRSESPGYTRSAAMCNGGCMQRAHGRPKNAHPTLHTAVVGSGQRAEGRGQREDGRG
eukprot:699927-Prymnesium_polylepis.1